MSNKFYYKIYTGVEKTDGKHTLNCGERNVIIDYMTEEVCKKIMRGLDEHIREWYNEKHRT